MKIKTGRCDQYFFIYEGDAAELGISHFSGSFLRPGVALEESWIRQQEFVSRAPRSNVIRELQKSESWETKQEI